MTTGGGAHEGFMLGMHQEKWPMILSKNIKLLGNEHLH